METYQPPEPNQEDLDDNDPPSPTTAAAEICTPIIQVSMEDLNTRLEELLQELRGSSSSK